MAETSHTNTEADAQDRLTEAPAANVPAATAAPAPKKAPARKRPAAKKAAAPAAKKAAEAHATKYVVLFPFVGTLTRGDVVTEEQLGSDLAAMIAEKSIRRATSKEAAGTYIEFPDGSPWDKEEEKK